MYYSPEIMTARSYVGPEVDAWCLGIILFRMTAGLELFAHAKSESLLFTRALYKVVVLMLICYP